MALEFSRDKAPGAFPTKIAAFAFGGGGFKSVGCFWPVLYHLGKTHDLKKLFHGSHIGAASGGGWFFTNLVFNRQVWESISTSKSEEQFMETFTAFFTDILRELRKNEIPLGMVKETALADALGNSHMKATLEGQGFPLFDRDMLEWIHHFLCQENGWKCLNDTLSHAMQDTPNAGLELTCDLANGILTKATIDIQAGFFTDHVRYTEMQRDGEQHVDSHVPMSINIRVGPKETTHTVSLLQQDQQMTFRDASNDSYAALLGNVVCRCGSQGSTVKVTKADLERGCKATLKRPADLAGPTSCYFACFNFNFFSSYAGLDNHIAKNILLQVEHKLLYKAFYGVDALDESGTKICPMRLVDGGPYDHTGIAMAVKGVQREGREGDIVAITLYSLDSYTNFHCLFTDFDTKGDHCGISEPPYPRIFKGQPPTSCAAYGQYLQVMDCEVETVDCPDFEVKGGQKYRLFHVFLMPTHLKLFPFKEESIQEYTTWCTQALKDLQAWSEGRMAPPS